jgi:hypothetical protein
MGNTNMVTIMIGSSCDFDHRDTRKSLIQVTSLSHSPRGEVLPLHHGAKVHGVDGVEGATGSGSKSISPPIL